MGFFDSLPAPPPPEPPRYTPPPEWHHPGHRVAPASLAVDGLLVRRPALAVFVGGLEVYPNGFVFRVHVLRRLVRGRAVDVVENDPFGRARPRRGGPGRGDDPDAERRLRFGVQYADGRGTIANTGMPRLDRAAPPDQPFMSLHSGHGGQGNWEQGYWVWGLPERGDVSLVYSWLAEDVPESRFAIDGDAVRAAADRAVRLWPEGEEGEGVADR